MERDVEIELTMDIEGCCDCDGPMVRLEMSEGKDRSLAVFFDPEELDDFIDAALRIQIDMQDNLSGNAPCRSVA